MFARNFIFHFILLWVLITYGGTSKRRYKVEFFSYTCKNFTSLFKILECNYTKQLTKDGSYSFAFNKYVMLERDLDKNFDIRLKVDVKTKEQQRIVHFVNVKLNACEAMAASFNNLMFKSLLDEVRKSSNFPYMCPIKKDVLYKLQNFTFNEKYLPTFTPSLNFTYSFEFFNQDTLFGLTQIMGAVASK